jgi:ATP-binding protein involved in chromosome partitioning
MASPQEILEDLKNIKYPGYSRDIVSFGMVRDIEVGSAGITVTLAPGGAKEENVEQIRAAVIERVRRMTGVEQVDILVHREQAPAQPRGNRLDIPGVRHVVAVASAKGGVGKSTVAVNLALALRVMGHRVGLLDADTYGPSVPIMMGLSERPPDADTGGIAPIEKFGVKVISLGLFIGDGTPVIWRGPMVSKLLTQFLHDVAWGELDFLIIDLPPGTGDAQLTIVQQVPLSGGVIVTTPQDVALLDVQRGIKMFNQVNAPVLGVVENMSYHICSSCGHRSDPFGHGGGARMAKDVGIPFLGEIPLVGAIRETGDTGEPIVIADRRGPHSQAFMEIARRVADALDRRAATTLSANR